jgi:hypothetical protein
MAVGKIVGRREIGNVRRAKVGEWTARDVGKKL